MQWIIKLQSTLDTKHNLWGKKKPLTRQNESTFHTLTQFVICCMEILFLKLACHYFWLGLIAILKNTLPIHLLCYWEHLWGTSWKPREHIENPLGTWMGTCWEQRKKGKKILFPPTHHPKLKRKKKRHFECMLSLLIGCMKFSISKTVHHNFWSGVIPPLYSNYSPLLLIRWGTSQVQLLFSIFFLGRGTSQFDWSITQKEIETMEAPQKNHWDPLFLFFCLGDEISHRRCSRKK